MVSREVQKKICLLGDSAVGKTSLIKKFVLDIFDDKYIATVGTKVTRKDIVIKNDVNLTLMIWDILGQQDYHQLRFMYFKNANGALVVCDITRRETLESLREWASSFFKTVGKVPVVFLANKYDLASNAQFGEENLKMIAEMFEAPYLYTSAKTGLNVEKAFRTLGELIV
jgi:small GTP-binding protein